MDKKLAAYWVLTGLLALPFGAGGIADLVGPEKIVTTFEHLGYPPYMMTIIGVAKLIGLAVVLAPGLPRLKEWAYAGFVIDLIGAFWSHAAVGDGLMDLFPPVAVLVLVLGSWALRPDNRRLA